MTILKEHGHIGTWHAKDIRTPGTNTLLYLPLDSKSTYEDRSLTQKTTTNTNVTFGAYKGVDCGFFSGSAHIQCTTLFKQTESMTIACRCYSTGSVVDNNRQGQIYDAGNNSIRNTLCYSIEGTRGYGVRQYGSPTYYSDVFDYTNQWVLLVATFSYEEMKLYVRNGTYNNTDSVDITRSAFTPTYINIGDEWNNAYRRRFVGGLSRMIVEDKIWTEQDKERYYELTKAIYGY